MKLLKALFTTGYKRLSRNTGDKMVDNSTWRTATIEGLNKRLLKLQKMHVPEASKLMNQIPISDTCRLLEIGLEARYLEKQAGIIGV